MAAPDDPPGGAALAPAGPAAPVVDRRRREAFDAFARSSAERLRTALVAHYGPEVGRDAAAEAMVYAWQHWDRVDAMVNPVGYLYRVGQTAARAEIRRGRVPTLPPVPPQLLQAIDPDLPRALLRLSDQQRVAVLLVHAYGWTLAEAADALSVSVSTLRNHLTRGLHRLRSILEDSDA